MRFETERPAGVLLVGDNQETTALISEFLRREGYAVGAIDNAFVAGTVDDLDTVSLMEAYDVVLLDLSRAGADAQELLRRVQASGVSLPIIALTATADEAHALETLQAGAFDYVAEPVDFAYLRQTVAAAVAFQTRRNRGCHDPRC
jgi:two-component system OmpR family response regulator